MGKDVQFPGGIPTIGAQGIGVTFIFEVPPGISAQEFSARLLSNHITVAASVAAQFMKNITVAVRPLTDLLVPPQ